MSLRAVYDDKVAGLRRDLDSLAADARARAASTETFAQALVRRMEERRLVPFLAGLSIGDDGGKRGSEGTGPDPKRQRANEESESSPPSLFRDDFQDSEPPPVDPFVTGIPPRSEDENLATAISKGNDLLSRPDASVESLREMIQRLYSSFDEVDDAGLRAQARGLIGQLVARIAIITGDPSSQVTQLENSQDLDEAQRDDDMGGEPSQTEPKSSEGARASQGSWCGRHLQPARIKSGV